MSKHKRPQAQPRIKGVKRTGTHSAIHPKMYDKIDTLASRYGVSRSWVIATILADGLSFGEQMPYYEMSKLRRVK